MSTIFGKITVENKRLPPSPVVGVGVVLRGEQVPGKYFGVTDVQVPAMGSDVQVGRAVARLPSFHIRVA